MSYFSEERTHYVSFKDLNGTTIEQHLQCSCLAIDLCGARLTRLAVEIRTGYVVDFQRNDNCCCLLLCSPADHITRRFPVVYRHFFSVAVLVVFVLHSSDSFDSALFAG